MPQEQAFAVVAFGDSRHYNNGFSPQDGFRMADAVESGRPLHSGKVFV